MHRWTPRSVFIVETQLDVEMNWLEDPFSMVAQNMSFSMRNTLVRNAAVSQQGRGRSDLDGLDIGFIDFSATTFIRSATLIGPEMLDLVKIAHNLVKLDHVFPIKAHAVRVFDDKCLRAFDVVNIGAVRSGRTFYNACIICSGVCPICDAKGYERIRDDFHSFWQCCETQTAVSVIWPTLHDSFDLLPPCVAYCGVDASNLAYRSFRHAVLSVGHPTFHIIDFGAPTLWNDHRLCMWTDGSGLGGFNQSFLRCGVGVFIAPT